MLGIEPMALAFYLGGYGWLLFKSTEIYNETPVNAFRDLIWAVCLALWPIMIPIVILRSRRED